MHNHGLSEKDALTVVSIDDGDRHDYLIRATACVMSIMSRPESDIVRSGLGKMTGNWYATIQTSRDSADPDRVLMELGSLFKDEPWDANRVPYTFLADIIAYIRNKKITTRSAKRILAMKFEGDTRSVQEIVAEEDLLLKPLSSEQYVALAQQLLNEKPDMVKDIIEKRQLKKIMWFVGQMMARSPDGSVEPDTAEETLQKLLGVNEEKW